VVNAKPPSLVALTGGVFVCARVCCILIRQDNAKMKLFTNLEATLQEIDGHLARRAAEVAGVAGASTTASPSNANGEYTDIF